MTPGFKPFTVCRETVKRTPYQREMKRIKDFNKFVKDQGKIKIIRKGKVTYKVGFHQACFRGSISATSLSWILCFKRTPSNQFSSDLLVKQHRGV